MGKLSLGIIVGNRDFFADELCQKARDRFIPVLEKHDIKPIILSENKGSSGSIQNREDALACASLFKKHSDEIKGIIVSLPNFGDEKSVATAIRESGLDVPVLVQAFNDDLDKLDYEHRRDSFCGKISVCNNLKQYGIKYTLTTSHTSDPESKEFENDLKEFAGICRVVDRLRGSRIGLIGARPADFNTVRYSEKILEKNRISVEPVGLLDFINQIDRLNDDQSAVKEALKDLVSYMDTTRVPAEAMTRMARLLVVYRNWVKENEIDALAFQCWDSLQDYLEINPCMVMSLLSNEGVPSACESDVTGALSMYALQAASGLPSGIVDWNNNYNNEPDKALIFHCGNYPGDIYHCDKKNCPFVSYPPILASTLGKKKTYGAIEGRIKPGKTTFLRISTDDNQGRIKAYMAEGEITEETVNTFGSWGVVRVEGLQKLMRYICSNGFEHHVAINISSVSGILEESLNNYLGWETYTHN
ncbi:MAG TPA: L-fucose/L-arabinose isomerase family protein [Halanaerobiales bacterium]|nr:L-fucose/L-arabinose isomerase family protein [Halanaerobiales bacterium]